MLHIMTSVFATSADDLMSSEISSHCDSLKQIDTIMIYLVGSGCFGAGFLLGGSITFLVHYCFSRTKNARHNENVELYHVKGTIQNGSDNAVRLLTAGSNTLRYDKSIYVSNSCPDIAEKRISPYAIARFRSEIEESCNETGGNTLKSETPTEIYAKVP